MKPDVLILTDPGKIGKREVKDFLWRLKNVLRDYEDIAECRDEIDRHAAIDNNYVVDDARKLIDEFEKICE